MLRIEAFFSGLGLTGLRFKYAHNIQRDAGPCVGSSMSADLDSNETIVRFDAIRADQSDSTLFLVVSAHDSVQIPAC